MHPIACSAQITFFYAGLQVLALVALAAGIALLVVITIAFHKTFVKGGN